MFGGYFTSGCIIGTCVWSDNLLYYYDKLDELANDDHNSCSSRISFDTSVVFPVI